MHIWVNPSNVARHHENNADKREQVCSDIDDNGFDWQIWAVAGSGFFTDSYNLFATNVILPSLAFIYWTNDSSPDHETAINAITLTGSLLGMLIFGFLADKYGRRKLYGLELIVVIFGTLGLVQSSAGYNNGSMKIMGWIMFWRFFVGLGIGAEYPLSAVITAEFAPRHARGRMMAAVFLMQPLGQILAAVVGLAVLLTVGKHRHLDTETDYETNAITVDILWRYVVGFGAIPAFIAIVFRLTIPESPRFTLDVDHDGTRALIDTQRYYKIVPDAANGVGETLLSNVNGYGDIESGDYIQAVPRAATGIELAHHGGLAGNDGNDSDSMEIQDAEDEVVQDHGVTMQPEPRPDPFSKAQLMQFFITEGNITYLLGTSICWFLLDFAFYGLGINNPRVIAQIWASAPPAIDSSTTIPDWANPSTPKQSIYNTLYNDGIQSIITVSIGSLLGSLILIKAIPYIPRKAWLVWSFVGMTLLFAIIGGSYFRSADTDLHALTITLYVLCQLLFNLGPNTLTFIIPAEIFPTRYRATCHGISAASGKLGSIVVQGFLPQLNVTAPGSKHLGFVLIGFSAAMGLGALAAWAWLPEVQDARGSDQGRKQSRRRRYEVPSKSLEVLAKGKLGVIYGDNGGERLGSGVRRRG